MGLLQENKRKSRINKDPNNTKWTRDTTTFGQKILRAQGWEPGQYLGAQDAAHSELHTAANASYIRVALKDDMKGLGFSKSKEDEVTGLDVFQDLLSRLNGKTDDSIQEDQQARLAVKTNYYVEQRYGPMRFVRGGLLVGDELKECKDDAEDSTSSDSAKDVEGDVDMDAEVTKKEKKEKKSKKRKASRDDDDDDDETDASERDSDSKSKKRRRESRKASDEATSDDDAKAARKKEKKSKKEKSKSRDDESEDDKVKESKRSKKDRKEKKEKKRRRKEAAAAEEESASSTQESTPALSAPGTGTSTPSGTGTSTPRPSRNFVRSRFIAQKKQAVLDTKALNQIFMVKA